MATTNLFSHPVFKDGAFTANDPRIRRHALRKTLDAIDLAAELGAAVFVMWGGREGVESDAAKDVPAALDCYAEAVNACCAYITDRGYEMEIALEPKPNEPRGNLLLPTVGHALAFIHELEFPEMVGLNPEFAHETMSGLSFHHAVAQALWADKLFHIDLNGQVPGKYDQDFRFGSEGVKDAFYLVKLLEDAEWDGMRHFDAHAYRTEDADGVWEFAQRLHAHVPRSSRRRRSGSREDPEIQEALAVAKVDQLSEPTLPEVGRGPLRTAAQGDGRRRRARRDRLRPRAARPARHRAPPRRDESRRRRCRSIAGVDSSTQSTKVEVRDAGLGPARRATAGRRTRRRRRRAREQDPEIWWRALERGPRRGRGTPTTIAAMSVAAQQHGLVVLDAAGEVHPAREALERHRVGARRGLARSASSTAAPRRGRRRAGRSRSRRSPSRSSRGCTARSPRRSRGSPACCCRTTGSRGGSPASSATDRGDASGTGYWSRGDGRVPPRPARDRRPRPRLGGRAARRCSGPRPPTGTGDNMAAALGLGLRPGDVAISLGTSGTVFAVSDTPTADPTGAVCGFADATGRLPPARVHAQRDQGHRRDRAPARRRPPRARRDGARGAARLRRRRVRAVPRRRAHAEPARRDRRPSPGCASDVRA